MRNQVGETQTTTVDQSSDSREVARLPLRCNPQASFANECWRIGKLDGLIVKSCQRYLSSRSKSGNKTVNCACIATDVADPQVRMIVVIPGIYDAIPECASFAEPVALPDDRWRTSSKHHDTSNQPAECAVSDNKVWHGSAERRDMMRSSCQREKGRTRAKLFGNRNNARA